MPRSGLLPLFAILALLLGIGCGGGDAEESSRPAARDTTAQQQTPFNKEGALAFVRGGAGQTLDTLSTLDVEIAESPEERERGLMQRLTLPEGSGMLFLFDQERPRSFWMKNTPMALDIFFADADSQIVRVAKNTEPYSTARIRSEAPARFVVEVPAGYAGRRGIVEGDRIRFRRTSDRPADSLASFEVRPRE